MLIKQYTKLIKISIFEQRMHEYLLKIWNKDKTDIDANSCYK